MGSLAMLEVFDLEVNSFGWCFRKIGLTTDVKAKEFLASQWEGGGVHCIHERASEAEGMTVKCFERSHRTQHTIRHGEGDGRLVGTVKGS